MDNKETILKNQREEARKIKNIRRNAMRVAKKNNLEKICEQCNSEEPILCFRNKNIHNHDPKNLYYLCKYCYEVSKFSDGRKREDFSICDICNKTKLCAPNLFNKQNICEKCFHEYCKKIVLMNMQFYFR